MVFQMLPSLPSPPSLLTSQLPTLLSTVANHQHFYVPTSIHSSIHSGLTPHQSNTNLTLHQSINTLTKQPPYHYVQWTLVDLHLIFPQGACPLGILFLLALVTILCLTCSLLAVHSQLPLQALHFLFLPLNLIIFFSGLCPRNLFCLNLYSFPQWFHTLPWTLVTLWRKILPAIWVNQGYCGHRASSHCSCLQLCTWKGIRWRRGYWPQVVKAHIKGGFTSADLHLPCRENNKFKELEYLTLFNCNLWMFQLSGFVTELLYIWFLPYLFGSVLRAV